MSKSNEDARSQDPHPTASFGADPAPNDPEEARQTRARVATHKAPVDLDVSWLVAPDLAAVDALARLQLAAARCGRLLCLHGADAGLVELLELVGLGQTLHLCACAHPLTETGDDDPSRC